MRKISWNLYLTTFIITIVIFLIGFYVGSIFENKAKADISRKIIDINKENTLSSLFYLTHSNKAYCPLYTDLLELDYNNIDKIGKELTYLEEIKGERDIELKKSYFIFELKTMLLTLEVNKICNSNMHVILYIYPTKCGSLCEEYEEKLKKKHDQNYKIFSFEDGIDSSVVTSLKELYNINKTPYIVYVN